MERRPTRQVYNEIITCRAIFLNLEESISHGSEREVDGAGGRAPAQPPWAPAQPQWPIRPGHADRAPSPLIFKENRAIKVALIQ